MSGHLSRQRTRHERTRYLLFPRQGKSPEAGWGSRALPSAAALANGTVFTLNTDLGILYLLAEVSGIGSYAEVRAASVEVDAFDRRVRALDLRALILAKKAAGRPKDLLILPELEGLLEAGQDE